MVALAAALFAGVALAGPPPQEHVSAGDVSAALFYTQTGPVSFTNFRIRIERAGSVLLDEPVPPYPKFRSYGVAPAGFGRKRSVSIRDLDGDGEPEVVLDLAWGGAHCCEWTRVYRFDPGRDTYVPAMHFWGDPGYRLQDLDADGKPELVTADDRFAYRFTSFASSGMPVRIWSYSHGRFTDVTRRFPKQITADAARWWRTYTGVGRRNHDSRGVLAAWAADEYLLGQGARAERGLAAALRRGDLKQGFGPSPQAYLRSLHRFLRTTGYIRG